MPWHPGARATAAARTWARTARGPRRVALNVGTSAALRVVLPEPLGPHAATPRGLWRYRIDARRSLVGGATSEGGNVLAWCRRRLALPGDPAALEAALGAADARLGTGSPRCPSWPASGARAGGRGAGGHVGPLARHGAVEIARALLEAWGSAWPGSTSACARWPPLITSWWARAGPCAHSPAWAQIVSDALGVPVALGDDAEASARGAALLALEALGVDVPEAPAPLRVLQPAPERHARYEVARERQRLLYDKIVGSSLS